MTGDDCFFVATGITDGELMQGVRYRAGGATTHSLVMRSRSGTIRSITSEHRLCEATRLRRHRLRALTAAAVARRARAARRSADPRVERHPDVRGGDLDGRASGSMHARQSTMPSPPGVDRGEVDARRQRCPASSKLARAHAPATQSSDIRPGTPARLSRTSMSTLRVSGRVVGGRAPASGCPW